MSLCITLAVFIGTAWFASELNAEPVVEDRSFARERLRDGIED